MLYTWIIRSRLLVVFLLTLGLAASVGCSEASLEEAKADGQCVNQADYTGRPYPFHTVAIDTQNSFSAETERFPTSLPDSAAAYITWDRCHIYFGYEHPSFGTPPAPHEYLVYYIDTDPLGDEGSDRGRALARAPRLPFAADYLVTIRTDGATARAGSSRAFTRNAQLYKYSQKWNPGLMQSWEPWKQDALTVGGSRTTNFIEAALDRDALGQPCAIRVVGWIVNTARSERRGFWPPPPSGARQAPASDSLTMDYYGFPLTNRVQPNASANLNRIGYDVVGACARGDQLTQ